MQKIIAVGHRGTNIGVPENSIASHEAAYAMGARCIEFDIQTTDDGVFVLFHDNKLGHKTTSSGKLSSKTWNQLKDVRLKYGKKRTDHKIPTLEAALKNVKGRFCVDLDFKDGPDDSAVTLRRLLKDAGFEDNGAPLVTIFCRNERDYDKVKTLNDIYAVRPLFQSKAHCTAMKTDDVEIMGLREYQLAPENISALHDLGIRVFANTMKENKHREIANHFFENVMRIKFRIKRKKPSKEKLLQIHEAALASGPLFIQTDYLDDLTEFLKAKGLYQDAPIGRDFKAVEPQADGDLIV